MLLTAANTIPFTFSPMSFITNLKYMGEGMLVIFVIIAIIVMATRLVYSAFSDKPADQ